ncbi:MAG: 4Fe-4S binding protein [Epsilonproteobacteria bacterium]|nr:4Fe-4S binding protein [Campylobacterota bacterium]
MVDFIKRNGNDLFKNRFFNFLFRHPGFVFAVRVFVALLFFYAIFMGFYDTSKNNIFTTAVFWGIFWPFFIVTTLPIFGRIFCGICPHGFLGKYITRIGLKKKMPTWLQNRFIGIMLLFLGWWGVYYMFPGLYRTPLGTALLFTVMTLVAFVFYYLYKDMSYCKYICPIGTALRGFGKLSFTWFGSYNTACSTCKTFDCAKSCPYGLSPFNFNKKASMNDCTLCMECTHACEALHFKWLKPGHAIYQNFKPLKAEVWVYILILAAIPISMAFHHGLGRSNIGESMIWAKTARWFESFIDFGALDATGLFAFLYAAIFTITAAVAGMWIASKILKKDFNTVFYTLGYAFAPLFILASMAHAWEYFFTGNGARIVEGLAWGVGMHVDVEPLAKRGDTWLGVFHLFRWVAVGWAFYILYRRFAYIDAPKGRKIAAYPFAALLILFFIGVNVYRGYVIDTYGRKARHGHRGGHAAMMHQKAAEVPKMVATERDTLWLDTRLPSAGRHRHGANMRMGMGMRRNRNGVPERKVYLLGGRFPRGKCVTNADGVFYTVDVQNRYHKADPKRRGCVSVRFKMPKSGYYKVYYVQERPNLVRVAKYEFKRFDHSSDEVYDRQKMAAKTIAPVPFDVLRLRPEDETFYSRLHTGDRVRFKVLLHGKPLAGATVSLTTQFGWSRRARTDKEGVATFTLIKDYNPEWGRFNKRFRERFLVTARYRDGDTRFIATQTGEYMPARSEYLSYAWGLVIALMLLIVFGGGVWLYRLRVHKPFKEVVIDE